MNNETQIYRCPVCNGNGLVPNGFYQQTLGTWVTSNMEPEKCRSCNASGHIIVTTPSDGQEPSDYYQNNPMDTTLSELKEKAEKWDALEKKLLEFYQNENGEYDEENPVRKGGLCEMGECAAIAFKLIL